MTNGLRCGGAIATAMLVLTSLVRGEAAAQLSAPAGPVQLPAPFRQAPHVVYDPKHHVHLVVTVGGGVAGVFVDTIRLIAIGAAVWVIEGADGTIYEPSGGLAAAFQIAGLAVHVEAELLPTAAPILPQASVILIHTLVSNIP
jgi:hypothetical protein